MFDKHKFSSNSSLPNLPFFLGPGGRLRRGEKVSELLKGEGGGEAGRENRARAAMCIPLRRIIWGYSIFLGGFFVGCT